MRIRKSARRGEGMMRSGLGNAARRLLRHWARPVRRDEGAQGRVIEPYRGYGSRHEIYLVGRVFRQPGARVRRGALLGDLRASLQRLVRRGAAGETVTARLADAEQRATTDRDGYFRFHMKLRQPLPGDRPWHRVSLSLPLPSGVETAASGQVFVPPEHARFVVISDIDDTVMHTGVANKARMLWRLFAKRAESRTAFPGVAALYRALHGSDKNPMLYVSRAPWSIYSMLETFFRLHKIPEGPILFLREWGVSARRPLPRRAPDHKLELIRGMLALYDDLPFVLIGDSGQHDAEDYARVVREHPGRVEAVYIRNVSRDPARIAAIEALAQSVLEAGSSLLLASDSVAIAEHAADRGLVPASTVQDVAGERRAETDGERRRGIRALRRGTRRQTERAVARGKLGSALDDGGDRPPNTLVEAGTGRHEHEDERGGRSNT